MVGQAVGFGLVKLEVGIAHLRRRRQADEARTVKGVYLALLQTYVAIQRVPLWAEAVCT